MAERIGIVPFWKNYDRKAVLRTAQLAEDLGYDSIWIPEAWAYEQFQLLTEIALATKRLKLATGIANVFSRSAGAARDERRDARRDLRGPRRSSASARAARSWSRTSTACRTRSRSRACARRSASCARSGAATASTPELSTLFDARHFKLEMTPLRPDIPIYVASLQEKAIREIGRVADGWVPTFWPYEHFKDGIALLAEGARAAGRDADAHRRRAVHGRHPVRRRRHGARA